MSLVAHNSLLNQVRIFGWKYCIVGRTGVYTSDSNGLGHKIKTLRCDRL